MKATFLDKLIGRMDRIDPASLHSYMERLAHEKESLEAILNTIKEGLIVTDAGGRIRYLNRAASEFIGADPAQAADKPIGAYMKNVRWQEIVGAASEESSRAVARELEIFYPQHRFVSFYMMPIGLDAARATQEEKPGYVVILSDVTEMRRRAVDTIESERLSALAMLAATVAHELGNPLNSLTIHLQLLEREVKKLPAAARKKMAANLEVALDEIARLDYLITGFLRAMRPSKPNMQLADVNELLRETLDVIQPELDDRGIVVEQRFHGKLPRAPLDAIQIQQAFFNVMKNAAQAMTSGGVLRMETVATDAHIVISFRDIGGGIPMRDIGSVFKPYYSTKSAGTGLGMMIVQRIVREHGGELELETEEGVGTTVRIRLLIHPRRVKLLEAPKEERKARKVKDVKKDGHTTESSRGPHPS